VPGTAGKVEGKFSPSKAETGDAARTQREEGRPQREEGKPAPPPAVPIVHQDPPPRPEPGTGESPGGKKNAEPPPPGVISLVAEEKPSSGNKNEGPPPGQAQAFPVSHLVEAGESYWAIAEKYYGSGNGRLHAAISSANGGGKLIAGKTIRIPAPPSSQHSSQTEPGTRSATTRGESTKSSRPPDGIVASDSKYDYYQVQKGDTLTGIAKRHLGSAGKVSALEAANPSLRYETLREGSRIRIPKK
jgi:nucleoid-associated protein YgaU